jgi:hypothetical protein
VVFFVANFLAIFAKDIWEKEILSQNSLCFLWKTNRQKRGGEKIARNHHNCLYMMMKGFS